MKLMELSDMITKTYLKSYSQRFKENLPEIGFSILMFDTPRTLIEFVTLPDISISESLFGTALLTIPFIIAGPALIDIAKMETNKSPMNIFGYGIPAKYRQVRKNMIAGAGAFALKFGLYSTSLYSSSLDENLLAASVVALTAGALTYLMPHFDEKKKLRDLLAASFAGALIAIYASFGYLKNYQKNTGDLFQPTSIEYPLDSVSKKVSTYYKKTIEWSDPLKQYSPQENLLVQ